MLENDDLKKQIFPDYPYTPCTPGQPFYEITCGDIGC